MYCIENVLRNVYQPSIFDGWYFLRKKRKQNREYYIHKDIFTKGGRVL